MMISRIAIGVWLAFQTLAMAQAGDDPIKLDSGRISGAWADEEASIRVYRGIPYAAPPVGELRWKPPQPVEAWDGVRECTEFGPACPQPDRLGIYGITLGETSEDCLFLNVWTPADPGDDAPVMMWIHGGGLSAGWGHQKTYDGTEFARRGVVLVTINYRLGPLGFFAHPALAAESEHDSSGNYGFLDQIAALQWIQRNIEAFGGDPDNVTIFGESAGGTSTAALCLSPLAKGLFHRAIMQSGTALWRMPRLDTETYFGDAVHSVGESYATAALGDATKENVLKRLRALSPDALLALTEDAPGSDYDFDFGAVIDGWVIPDRPAKLYAEGRFNKTPIIAGTNADEGSIFALRSPTPTVDAFEAAVRRRWGPYADRIIDFYGLESNQQAQKTMARFLGESRFVAPTRGTIRASVEGGVPAAYLYRFSRKSETNMLGALGAFHAMELPYVFNTERPPAMGAGGWTETDQRLRKAMIAYWTQFARTGNPNTEGLPEWPEYMIESDRHLEFGAEIQAGKHLDKGACDLYESIMNEVLSE